MRLLCVQVFEEVQEDQPEGAEVVVQADPEGARVPALPVAADYPQGSEVRQHLHYRNDGVGENRRSGIGDFEEPQFCEIGES